MLEIILTAFTFFLFAFSIKKCGFLPFPTGLILILGTSQVMFALAHYDLVTYEMHSVFDYGGSHKYYTLIQALYSFTALSSLCMLVGKFNTIGTAKFNTAELAEFTRTRSFRIIETAVAIILLLHMLFFIFLCDWNLLWLHKVYLAPIVDVDIANMLGEDFSSTIMRIVPIMAIVSSMCIGLSANTKHMFLKVIAITGSLLYFTVMLATNSRAASFVPAIIAINYSVLKMRGRMFIVPLMVIIVFVAFTSALKGRAGSEHGLSTIPETLSNSFGENVFPEILKVVMETCQGVFVTAESLTLSQPFSTQYELLSFSPLPSFVDGFSSILMKSQHRLHLYVPMSGIGEVIIFGWVYELILLLILVIIVRTHCNLADKNIAIFILCNFLIMFSVYLLFSYPIRSALRYAWLAFAVSLVMRHRRRQPDNYDKGPIHLHQKPKPRIGLNKPSPN